MSVKSNLLRGIYVNNEFPPHVKRNQDRLCPILHLARSNSSYKDKCKLEGDSLVIDGRKYTINEIGNLPPELTAFQSVQKTDDQYLADDQYLVFHREWSPFSNFHHGLYSPLRGNTTTAWSNGYNHVRHYYLEIATPPT